MKNGIIKRYQGRIRFKTKSGYSVSLFAGPAFNVWLIEVGPYSILVDSGIRRTRRKLQKELKRGINITHLILTHTHFDHCKNASFLKQKSGCKVVVSKYADKNVERGYTDIPNGVTFWAKALVWLGRKLRPELTQYKPFNSDITVGEEGFSFRDNGINIAVILTPGHSPDSLSIIVDEEIALVGDTLYGVVPKRIMPPFADDIPLMKKQWRLLFETDCHTFLPGHGLPVSRKLLKRFVM